MGENPTGEHDRLTTCVADRLWAGRKNSATSAGGATKKPRRDGGEVVKNLEQNGRLEK